MIPGWSERGPEGCAEGLERWVGRVGTRGGEGRQGPKAAFLAIREDSCKDRQKGSLTQSGVDGK